MDAQQFLNLVVLPNMSDWKAEPSDIRLAHNCIASIDALASHIFWTGFALSHEVTQSSKSDTDFRERLAEESSSFRVVRDIAKAQKHVILSRGLDKLTVRAASDIRSAPVPYGAGVCGRGRYGGPPQVLADQTDGSWDYVETLATEALVFLQAKLQAVTQ